MDKVADSDSLGMRLEPLRWLLEEGQGGPGCRRSERKDGLGCGGRCSFHTCRMNQHPPRKRGGDLPTGEEAAPHSWPWGQRAAAGSRGVGIGGVLGGEGALLHPFLFSSPRLFWETGQFRTLCEARTPGRVLEPEK